MLFFTLRWKARPGRFLHSAGGKGRAALFNSQGLGRCRGQLAVSSVIEFRSILCMAFANEFRSIVFMAFVIVIRSFGFMPLWHRFVWPLA